MCIRPWKYEQGIEDPHLKHNPLGETLWGNHSEFDYFTLD